MKYTISIESFSLEYLNKFFNQLVLLLSNKIYLKNLNYNENNYFKTIIVFLPTKVKKYTLNKSPHVNKKAREQFETRIYRAIICIYPLIPLKKQSFFLLLFFLKKMIKKSRFFSFLKSKIVISL